jgi:hypothetical protein
MKNKWADHRSQGALVRWAWNGTANLPVSPMSHYGN